MADQEAGMTGQVRGPRDPAARRADHAAIDRLADELLPALVAKLGASGLGELDVREGDWRVRLRMPADGRGARRTGGPGRGAHAGQGPAAIAHPAPEPRSAPAAHAAADGRPAPGVARGAPDADPPTRAVATSPAVGFYRPRPGLAPGARVRAGDRLGTVDVLGVPQELVSPADGIVGASLVEPGDPVEYGQEVLEVELLAAPAGPAARVAVAITVATPAPAMATPAPVVATPAPVPPTPAGEPG